MLSKSSLIMAADVGDGKDGKERERERERERENAVRIMYNRTNRTELQRPHEWRSICDKRKE